jgi:DUF4097 and DUF4098 domain-containing protein YvlB
MRRIAILGILPLAAATLSAQNTRAQRFMDNCDRSSGDSERFCDVRELTLPVTAALNVDGRQNGGITVHGWDRAEIHVTAMIQAQSETQSDAQALAKGVAISTTGGQVRASGPDASGQHTSWSVSYDVYVPRRTNLTLNGSNGGLSVDGVQSKMELETVNGGITLTDVDGDIRGTTVNGGVTVDLSGDGWRGGGLELVTTNGGVHVNVPANYSAQLDASTQNGGLDVGFPVRMQGTIGRRISTQLGAGGAPIHLTTQNGGVSVRRR